MIEIDMGIIEAVQTVGFPIVMTILMWKLVSRLLEKQHEEHRQDRNRWKLEDQEIQKKMIGRIDELFINHERWEDKRDDSRGENINSLKEISENRVTRIDDNMTRLTDDVRYVRSGVQENQAILTKIDNKIQKK